MPDNVTQLKLPPIRLTEAESAALQHDSYLVQIRNQICSHCKCGERWVEIYEVWIDPIKTRTSKLAVKRPTTTIKRGFDLTYFEMPLVEVPVCSECIPNFKVDEAAAIPVASRDEWARTLQRKYTPAPTSGSDSRRPEPRLDQL